MAQNYQEDKEAIEAFLNSQIDSSVLQQLKKGASLVEAPNIDRRAKEEDLRALFRDVTEKKDRNRKIAKAYKEGYSQHMIAKVLGISQPAVFGIIKNYRGQTLNIHLHPLFLSRFIKYYNLKK